MRRLFRGVSIGVVVLAVVLWFFGGMNLSRTALRPAPVVEPSVSEATDAAGIDFRPGWDFLLGSGIAALMLFLVSREPAGRRAS